MVWSMTMADAARHAAGDPRDHRVHRLIVGQDHVNLVRPGNGLLWRGRHLCAGGLERMRLRRRAVPHRNRQTAAKHRLHHGAAEQPGAKKCD